MANGNVGNQLYEFWEEVSKNWSAEAKSKYYSVVFSELMQCADGIYANNADLQREAQACQSMCYPKGDY